MGGNPGFALLTEPEGPSPIPETLQWNGFYVRAPTVLTFYKSVLVGKSLSKRFTTIFLVAVSRHIFNRHSVLLFIGREGFFYPQRQEIGYA